MPRRAHWKGGYIRKGKKGPTYVIERWVNGIYYHVSTKCRTKEGAIAQLARFEADPAHYEPGNSGREILTITPTLVEEYSAWMLDVKKNSPEWVTTVMRFLAHWRADLGSRDLRDLNLQRDVKPALDRRKSSRKHRVEALKAFCTWLRREKGLLTHAEDRTLDLPVPSSRAEKLTRRKALPQEQVRLVLEKLAQGKEEHHRQLQLGEEVPARWHPRPPSDTDASRDVMTLQTGTGWHISEVRRFAESGEIVQTDDGSPVVQNFVAGRDGQIRAVPVFAVLVTKHKGGDLTRTPLVAKEHVDAAKRLRARGGIPTKETLIHHLAWACRAVREDQAKAKVPEAERIPEIRLGQMRHCVLTWAVEMGATPEQASEFAGHRSVATSKKWYIDLAIPTVTVPVLRLVRGGGASGS